MPLVLPSSRLFLTLFATALLVAWEPWVGFLASVALLLLAALDAALAFRLGRPEIWWSAPARLGQGEEREAVLEIQNRSGRRMEMRLAFDVAAGVAGPGAADVRTVVLEPGERGRFSLPITARARGTHEVSALHLRLRSPLGLVWWQWTRRLDHRIEVIPGLREVRSYRLLAVHHHLYQAGLRNVRGRGEGGAFESLREYVRGDDTRHMDWKATARRKRLMVRQYEAERSQNIMLCIDTGRLMAEEVGGGERLDKALAAAVVLSEVARVWKDHVGVFAFSDRVQAVLPPGRYRPERIPAIFAGLESRTVEPDYPRALTRLSRVVTRRALLVFFGDVIDDEVSGPLSAQLGRLARRHVPLFIALRNTELFAAAAAPAAGKKEAYRRAAATELVLARARTLSRMREGGIRVADVSPDAAVAAAVNRYMEIKRRAAL